MIDERFETRVNRLFKAAVFAHEHFETRDTDHLLGIVVYIVQ